jgi:hypothetical protein
MHQSFIVQDWKDVKAMLKQLPNDESEQVQGIEPLFGI